MNEYGVGVAVLAVVTAAAAVYQIFEAMYLPAIGLFVLSATLFLLAAALNG